MLARTFQVKYVFKWDFPRFLFSLGILRFGRVHMCFVCELDVEHLFNFLYPSFCFLFLRERERIYGMDPHYVVVSSCGFAFFLVFGGFCLTYLQKLRFSHDCVDSKFSFPISCAFRDFLSKQMKGSVVLLGCLINPF